MTQQHPITPPPELVQQWREQAPRYRDGGVGREDWLMARAAQWGADQELEACRMEIIDGAGLFYIDETSDRVRLTEDIWIARRPKPPSLKEKGMKSLDNVIDCIKSLVPGASVDGEDIQNIRHALEQLPDHE
jgi:hypothetical protein